VLVVLIALFAAVASPAISMGEETNASTYHDAGLVDVLHYLQSDPAPGNVLTLPGSVRWVEAVTVRGAFDNGPTWLLFEPWQIVNAEESFWAENCRYALTNNVDVIAFSGGYTGVDTSPAVEAPLYAAYVDGVAIPLLDLGTQGVVVNATVNGTSQSYAAGTWGAPTLTVVPGALPVGYLNFTGPYFDVSERAGPTFPSGASISVTVRPLGPTTVRSVSVRLAMPSTADGELHAPASVAAVPVADGLLWSVSTVIGPNVSPSTVTATATFAPTPAAIAASLPGSANAATMLFNGSGAAPTNLSIALSTSGTENSAVTLPSVLDTAQFLSEDGIHFLLFPSRGAYAFPGAYYQNLFGWHVVYTSSEWEVTEA
jgi:hypothetical protein